MQTASVAVKRPTASEKVDGGRKKDSNAPKRAISAYFYWLLENRPIIAKSGVKPGNVLKVRFHYNCGCLSFLWNSIFNLVRIRLNLEYSIKRKIFLASWLVRLKFHGSVFYLSTILVLDVYGWIMQNYLHSIWILFIKVTDWTTVENGGTEGVLVEGLRSQPQSLCW